VTKLSSKNYAFSVHRISAIMILALVVAGFTGSHTFVTLTQTSQKMRLTRFPDLVPLGTASSSWQEIDFTEQKP
jgi:succinate dehydrogenase/fumarate reductase cytochrome b subunit